MNIVKRVILALAAFACSVAAASEGIAFITNIKGEVSLDGVARPAVLSEVSRGQKIAVGKESLAQVMYIASGKEYVLKGPADYVVGTTEVTGTAGIRVGRGSRVNPKRLIQVLNRLSMFSLLAKD